MLRDLIYLSCGVLILLFGIFCRKIDDWDKKRTKTELSSQLQKRRDKAIKVIRIIALVLATIIFVEVVPSLMDFPYLIQGKYKTAIGEIEEVKQVDENRFKVLLNGEEEWYDVNIDRIEMKDQVVLAYLPHSKKAIVVEINGVVQVNTVEETKYE